MNYMLIRNYGITSEEFDALFEQQNGVCAICGQEEFHIWKRRLSVDHDHETGRIRGLLCHNCNNMLGHAKDNVKTLMRAIAYLEGKVTAKHG